MKRTWTDEQKQFLRDNYRVLSYEDIAVALGKTVSQIKSQASNMKITVTRKWPESEIEYLRTMYADTPTQQIADHLGKKLGTVYSRADKLGLKKSAEYLASPAACRLRRGDNVGAKTRFPPGHEPFNKGTKGLTGTHPNSRTTQFRKGHRCGMAAKKYQPIGTERTSKEGYLERKINDDMPFQSRWKAVHRILWEAANGPVPKGHNIVFRDDDKTNLTLDNLECVSRADWMKRHTFHNYPEPVKQQIHILAVFKRRLNRYAEKQDRRPAEPVV